MESIQVGLADHFGTEYSLGTRYMPQQQILRSDNAQKLFLQCAEEKTAKAHPCHLFG